MVISEPPSNFGGFQMTLIKSFVTLVTSSSSGRSGTPEGSNNTTDLDDLMLYSMVLYHFLLSFRSVLIF